MMTTFSFLGETRPNILLCICVKYVSVPPHPEGNSNLTIIIFGNLFKMFDQHSVCVVYGQGWTDTEADLSSMGSRPASRQVSSDIHKDLSDFKRTSSLRLKVKSRDSGVFDRTSSQSLAEPNLNRTCTYISVSESLQEVLYLTSLIKSFPAISALLDIWI